MKRFKVALLVAALALPLTSTFWVEDAMAEEESHLIDEIEQLTKDVTVDLERVADLIRQMRDREADRPRTYTQGEYDELVHQLETTQEELAEYITEQDGAEEDFSQAEGQNDGVAEQQLQFAQAQIQDLQSQLEAYQAESTIIPWGQSVLGSGEFYIYMRPECQTTLGLLFQGTFSIDNEDDALQRLQDFNTCITRDKLFIICGEYWLRT